MTMSDREQAISDEIRATINGAMTGSERSQQSAAKRLGISDLGTCRHKTQLMIENVPYSDEQNNYLPAFVGTAVGDMVEKNLPYETQGEVKVTIPMRDGYTLNLTGHPDIILRDDDGKVTAVHDLKTRNGLGVVRKYGTPQNNIWQVTAYGKALIDAGEADPDTLELALIYIDRSGDEQQPLVKAWKWSQEDWDAIVEWLDDVIEAMVTGTDASRDMPRDSFCVSSCPYYTVCWQDQTDATGLLDQEQYVTGLEAYLEGGRLEKEGKALKKAAQSQLKGATGNVPTSEGLKAIRWVTVAGGEVSFTRQPYERLSITAKKNT